MYPSPCDDTNSQWHGLFNEARDYLELYPPRAVDSKRHYAVGQPVWVLNGGKPFARAFIASSLDTTDSKFSDRYRVRYSDGTHYHCRVGALRPLYGATSKAKTTIIVTALTSHYRQLARLQITPGESALEIGSDLGACTAVLAESADAPPPNHSQLGVEGEGDDSSSRPQKVSRQDAAGRAIGIDKSSKSVEEARRRYPGVPFHCVDVLTTPGVLARLATSSSPSSSADAEPNAPGSGSAREESAGPSNMSKEKKSSFDAVFIDINGNRMIEAVAEVARLVSRELAHCPPRLIVIKSSEMAKALQAVLDKQS